MERATRVIEIVLSGLLGIVGLIYTDSNVLRILLILFLMIISVGFIEFFIKLQPRQKILQNPIISFGLGMGITLLIIIIFGFVQEEPTPTNIPCSRDVCIKSINWGENHTATMKAFTATNTFTSSPTTTSTVTPTPSPTYTSTPTLTPTPTLILTPTSTPYTSLLFCANNRVNKEIYVRKEPIDGALNAIGTIKKGKCLLFYLSNENKKWMVLAPGQQNSEGVTWYYEIYTTGWVSVEFLDPSGNYSIENLPVITSTPTITLQPTPQG